MIFTFFVNLLCAFVSCAPNRGAPFNDIPNSTLTAQFERERKDLREPIIMTSNGRLEGYVMRTIRGRSIYAFQGIPYGEPPVARLRFRAPVPARKWTGVKQARASSPLCLQVHGLRLAQVMGSEDCLYMDIYTPKLPASLDERRQLPVIIFFHGGSFLYGGAREYGPAYLLEQDVVLAVVNYRLGVLGFLSTGDKACPGNFGLKDQALAIKWVYENAANFGGDPFRITLLGQSAGAASAHLHMMSPLSKKYLTSAISLSGTAFNFWAVASKKRASDQMKNFARIVQCPSDNSWMLLECLSRLNPVLLVNSQRHMAIWRASELVPVMYAPQVVFGPVVEPNATGAFLTETPDEAYSNGHVAKIPWISTIVENEGNFGISIVEGFGGGRRLRRDWYQIAKHLADYRYLFSSDAEADIITDKVSRFYLGSLFRTSLEINTTAIGKIMTDRYFSFAHLKSLKKHSQLAPTYGYLFNYQGRYGTASVFNFPPQEFGASHSDDFLLIFNSSLFSKGLFTSDEEFGMTKVLTNLIGNFAQLGEPLQGEGIASRKVRIWEPVLPFTRSEDIQLLQVDLELKMVANPFLERIEFWKGLRLPDMIWT